MEYPTSYPTSSPDETNFEVIERSIALFVILGIICGNITEYMFENVSFPIPYHVVVFFEGVIISVLLKYVILESTTFENVICEPSVSSDLIIYVFLPALLFKETMNLNWHHVTSGFSQYMLLAGPGCLFGGLVTGVLSYYILWHLNWSWQVCFLFGSILSTTDPVSIIAVLNSTGASHKLSTVIVGESLFNDGSAMLMYFFFYQEQTYTSNASLLVAFIFKMVFGSPVMGITFGLITHKLMRFFDTPDESKIDIQIAITLACAYISFYVAEGPCEVSGVLSCCSAGLVISWLGSPKILDNDKMHSIWENLEWFCNTLIFFIAGLIAGSKALSASEGSIGKDFASLFIMYIVVTIVRYVMILLAYPVLKDIGFKLTFNEAMFIGFSGLRGALGISLSLIVQSNFSNAPNFFFLYAGIAALTLLINGSLATLMIRFLRLVEDPDAPKSPEMNLVLRQIKRSIRLKVHKELENMKSELGDYNADEVNKLCRVLRGSRDLGNVIVSPAEDLKSMINRISIDSSIYHSTLGDMKDDENQTQRPRVSIDLLAFVRATFLDTLKARYWDCIRSGKLGTHAYSAKLLLYSVDVAQDHVNNPNIGFADWDCIENGLKVNGIYLAFCRFLDDVCEYFSYYPGFVSYAEAKRERMAIYTLLNFIDAHTFAQSKIHEFLGGGQDDDISIIEESMARKHSTTEVSFQLNRLITLYNNILYY